MNARFSRSFATIVAVFCALVSQGEEISTGDGLRMDIDSQGAFSSLRVDGRELLDTNQHSGIVVRDFVSKKESEVQLSPDPASGNPLRLMGSCQDLGLALTTEFREHSERIECWGTITDLSGTDRAVQVAVKLNLRGEPWKWAGNALAEPKACPQGEVHRNCEPIPSPRWTDVFPFSCMVDPEGQSGLSLATPMDVPRIHRTQFVQNEGGGCLQIEFDLGLSAETRKFLSSASFCFLLQRIDASQGFRSAARQYYRAFPGFYRTSVKRHGSWSLWAPSWAHAWWEFGVSVDQLQFFGEGEAERVAVDDAYGVQSIVYSEPHGYWAGYGREGEVVDEKTVTQSSLEAPFLASRTLPEHIEDGACIPNATKAACAGAVLNCAIEAIDGSWQRRHWTTRFGRGKGAWTLLFLNPDPELPQPNRAWQAWTQEYLKGAALAREKGGQIDGVYIDSATGWCGMDADNYRREHWAYADIPLTFDWETGKPVQLHGFALCEYMQFLRTKCDERDWIMLANGWFPHYIYLAHMLDVVGGGENTALNHGHYWLSGLRTIAAHKPVSILDYSMVSKEPHAGSEEAERVRLAKTLNLLLLWDVMPGTGDWTVEGIERSRPLMRRYVPEFIALSEAGWRPVPGAKSKEFMVERYGDFAKGNLSFAVHNPDDSKTVPGNVVLDSNRLGLSGDISALLLPALTPIPCDQGGSAFAIPALAPGETAVLRIGTKEQLRAFLVERCGLYVGYMANLATQAKNDSLTAALNWRTLLDALLSGDCAAFGRRLEERQTALDALDGGQSVDTAKFYVQRVRELVDLM